VIVDIRTEVGYRFLRGEMETEGWRSFVSCAVFTAGGGGGEEMLLL
jgi:hypothetical protein